MKRKTGSNNKKNALLKQSIIITEIARKYHNIELVQVGYLKINPYNQIYIGEKGVDIALAVKMLSLSYEKKCDRIILLSGDYDYIEAMRKAKDNLNVDMVKFYKGSPPHSKNSSERIRINSR